MAEGKTRIMDPAQIVRLVFGNEALKKLAMPQLAEVFSPLLVVSGREISAKKAR